MGNCVERTSGETIHLDEHLLFKDHERFQGGLWCSAQKDNGTSGPFHFRVRFQPGKHLDNEAKVVEALMELLWVNPHAQKDFSSTGLRLPGSSQSAAMRCVAALKSLKASQADTVLDFVVPIINVILHAPCMEVRNVLWECFVLEAVRSDVSFGHLFFWALRAVESSPQAKIAVQTDAQRRMHAVQGTICSKAQLKITMRHLEEANAAVRRGERLPEVPKADPNRVSPLVDVCERLHYIGTQIVQERDRQQRLYLLQTLLDQEINKYLKDDTPVPAQMLAPHAGQRKPLPGDVASLLRINRHEARVLSSKARAPYMVMMEVEEKPLTSNSPGRPGLLRRLCGGRKSPVQATHHFAAVPPKSWPPEDCSPSTSRSSREARPKGAFHDETWSEVVQRVRTQSDFGRRPNWSMIPLIVKSNADDVRQEELAYRLLKWFERVFRKHNPKLWLQPFLIIATTHDGGVLEVVTNAISISELKKSYGQKWVSLKRYFEDNFTGDDRPHGFGREKSVSLRTATSNFIYSMAAYSVICFVLAIRDRHNGNIMLNDEGHVLHVDFGFMLCGAPGGKAMQHIGGFEHSAGFKLTNELVEVLGPTDGNEFKDFRSAIQDGMKAVRAHAQELLALLQLSMLGSENSQMNCFCHPRGYPEAVLEDICDRLGLPGGVRNGGNRKVSDEEFRRDVDRMIDDSIDHWRSRLYDSYQYHFVGVH